MEQRYSTVEEAIEELRAGRIILTIDDPDRENEGDMICAAQFATTENVNLMATVAKGLICTPMSEAANAPTRTRGPRISAARGMCSRWWHGAAGCWCATGIPKRRSTCAALRGWSSAGCAVKSCVTTGR